MVAVFIGGFQATFSTERGQCLEGKCCIVRAISTTRGRKCVARNSMIWELLDAQRTGKHMLVQMYRRNNTSLWYRNVVAIHGGQVLRGHDLGFFCSCYSAGIRLEGRVWPQKRERSDAMDALLYPR